MLEKFLQKTRGVVLGAIVALLCAVFVLQFGGPQAQGCSGGPAVTEAATVYGKHISRSDARAAFILVGGDRYPPDLAKQNRLQEMVVYGLVEEALLARQAREIGYGADADDVMEQVIDEGLVYVPMSVEAGPYLPPAGPRRYDFSDKDGQFSKDNLKRFIQGGLQRSVRDFTQAQVTATLAQRMRETVMSAVEVGPGEIWDAYVREQEHVTVTYARFSPSYYESRLDPAPADIDAFMKDAKADIDAAYETQRHRYTDLEKQVRARHILTKVPDGADEAARTEARARAEALLKRAQAGEDFAALAREHSEDQASAKKGGDLGWNPKGRMVAPFDEAQFALSPGQVGDALVESSFGFHVIKVDGIREGDVPIDEAKREIAEDLYRERRGQAQAEAAAKAALAQLAGGVAADEVDLGAQEDPDDPLAPDFRESQAFGRTDTPVAGGFDGSEFTRAAFRLTSAAPLPDAPLKLGEEYFVFKLIEKNEASREAFTDAEQDRLQLQLLSRKRASVLRNYVRELLRQAQNEGEVAVDPVMLEG